MFAFQCCENLPLVSIESFVPTLNEMVMLKTLAR